MCTYFIHNGKPPCCTHDCDGCMWNEEDEESEDAYDEQNLKCDIGIALVEFRSFKNWSQEELAHQLNIDIDTIRKLENAEW